MILTASYIQSNGRSALARQIKRHLKPRFGAVPVIRALGGLLVAEQHPRAPEIGDALIEIEGLTVSGYTNDWTNKGKASGWVVHCRLHMVAATQQAEELARRLHAEDEEGVEIMVYRSLIGLQHAGNMLPFTCKLEALLKAAGYRKLLSGETPGIKKATTWTPDPLPAADTSLSRRPELAMAIAQELVKGLRLRVEGRSDFEVLNQARSHLKELTKEPGPF